MKIKVKANRHVVGLKRGQTGWVEDSRKVQSLIRVGYLVRVQDLELPEMISAGFSDEPLPEIPEKNYGPDSTELVDYEPALFRQPVSDDFGKTYNVVPFDEEDEADLALAHARLEDDSGVRVSLDDVLDEFGMTREELEAYTDPDES